MHSTTNQSKRYKLNPIRPIPKTPNPEYKIEIGESETTNSLCSKLRIYK